MKLNPGIKSWLLVTLIVAFVSACTTTQEELSAGGEDGAPVDDSQSGSSAIADGSITDSSGAEATGLDGADGSDGDCNRRLRRDDRDGTAESNRR